MELPSRPKTDRYTRPGEYNDLERRLRSHPACGDIPVLVAYAFDWRTRLGPYLFVDRRLLPGGPRAIGSAMYSAGFTKLRIMQRQWNRYLCPSEARFDGVPPQILLVSSMQIHSASAYELIADSYKLGDQRPLVIAGGAKAIYEPWDFFNFEHEGKTYNADVACTGEEFVLLELLDRIMESRGQNEHPRKTFHRLRRSGLLDDILGLVYRSHDWHESQPREQDRGTLIDTGTQRLVQNLDELPHPIDAYGLYEPKHSRRAMSRHPIPMAKLRKTAGLVSLVTTHGCKFHCPYCPIPAYNQFTFRHKSPQRMRDEIEQIYTRTGIDFFFGTDDNFFNNRETVEETFTELAKGKVHGKPFRDKIVFGTEATEFDVYKNQDLLPLCRAGGLRAIWFGIEDMTAELVKKGQSPEKTKHLFQIMNKIGIAPMSMMMHHDGQPLASRGSLYGLLNQVRFLRKSGSVSLQVTILTPSVGSKGYEESYDNKMVIEQAGEMKLEDYQYDGNFCIATNDPKPWRKQLNIYLAYMSFYNPINFLRALFNWKDPVWLFRVGYQVYGMAGLVKSLQRGFSWLWSLYRGPVKKMDHRPRRRLLMVPPPVSPAQTGHTLQTQTV